MSEGGRKPDSHRSAADEVPELTDPRALRALIHPVRLSLLEYLEGRDSATATECAEVVGMSPSATSYHLREMARYGLITETTGADKRERRWRAALGGLRFGSIRDDPELLSAATVLAKLMLSRADLRAQRYMEESPSIESDEWWHAAHFVESNLLMSPAELRDFNAAINEVTKRYSNKRADAPEGARRVHLTLRAFPLQD